MRFLNLMRSGYASGAPTNSTVKSSKSLRKRSLYSRRGAKYSPRFTFLLAATFACAVFASKVFQNWHFYNSDEQLLQRSRRASNCPDQAEWTDRTTYPDEVFYLGNKEGSFTTCEQRAFVPFYLIGALYMFLALAIVCDDFFVPSLEVIIEKTHLPEDVAGATFMAAGGSAPELFTSLCGIMFSGSVDVGIGTIVGSAVFNVLFVIAICAFGTYFGPTDKTTLDLTWYPFTRDVTFYSCGLAILIGFFADSTIYLYEAAILFAWYVVYCLFMIVNERFQVYVESKVAKLKSKIGPKVSSDTVDNPRATSGGSEREPEVTKEDIKPTKPQATKEEHSTYDEHEEKGSTPDDKEKRKEDSGDDDDDDDGEPMDLFWPKGKSFWVVFGYLVTFPIKFLLMITVPDVRRGRPDDETGEVDKDKRCWWWGYNLFPITFVMSIIWIGIYSYFMVWWVERMGFLLTIESSIMGLTLLAAGTSIPDLITSYLVASKGFGDMALSSSIGSNLFDICVGLPIPWMIYLAIEASIKVTVDSTGLICYILMLFAMLIAVFICILVMQWKLNLGMGILMMALYVVFLVFAILIGQDVIPCILD